jgi:hypothetical protein
VAGAGRGALHRSSKHHKEVNIIAVAGHIPLLTLVVEAYGDTFNILGTIIQYWGLSKDQNCTTKIKIMALTYSDSSNCFPILPPTPMAAYSKISLRSHFSTPSSRILLRAGRLRARIARSKHDTGSDSLRPLIKQLVWTGGNEK